MKSIRSITVCSLFSALICIGAFIRIPLPALPVTMQVLFVILSGMILGGKKSFISVLIYIIIGLTGLPVFSGGGGLSYVLHPTFGYLCGFLAAAYVTGIICEKSPCMKGYLISGFAGIAVIYAFGAVYYYFIARFVMGQIFSLRYILIYCVLTTLPVDIISAVASAMLTRHMRKVKVCRFYS